MSWRDFEFDYKAVAVLVAAYALKIGFGFEFVIYVVCLLAIASQTCLFNITIEAIFAKIESLGILRALVWVAGGCADAYANIEGLKLYKEEYTKSDTGGYDYGYIYDLLKYAVSAGIDIGWASKLFVELLIAGAAGDLG